QLSLAGGTVLLNGVVPGQALTGRVPPLPPGSSTWRFRADVVVPDTPAGRALPVARFEGAGGLFDRAVLASGEPAVELEVAAGHYHPGTFTVRIPYDIPGFTEQFDAVDHPRDQIRGLVRRVKAAGVEARVAYWHRFAEDHGPGEALGVRVAGGLLFDTHATADALSAASRRSGREDQGALDALVLSGVFEMTRFDSLNSFA
ncbi:MAG TPA: hypothetical protein VGX50_10780, partial [Longimicrobium sp.]|nr:hypothetical protein [Longimicrobium sp.]